MLGRDPAVRPANRSPRSPRVPKSALSAAASDVVGALTEVVNQAAEGSYGTALTQLGRLEGPGDFAAIVETMQALLARVEAREQRLQDLVTGTIRALVTAEDAKSKWTAGHSFRVAGLAVKVGEAFLLSRSQLRELYYAALLHDIGKIGVPGRILDNTTPTLSPEDMDLVKQHPEAGQQIVEKMGGDFHRLSIAIRHHHERWDGAGYPDGLSAETIPFLSRIIAVCDSYDAMRMDRPYQKGLGGTKIRAIFEKGRGQSWDPAVIDVFLSTVDVPED